jgi:DNA-directed RNA polymerase subunit RPC12/RpoP
VSRLIAQIMLSILLFPLAGLVYLVTFVVYLEAANNWSPNRDEAGFLTAGVASWAFVAVYWILLWRGGVRWTGARVSLTATSFLGAAVAGAVVGGMVYGLEDEIGFFVGSAAAPLLWQVATIFVWRETAAERAARLSKQGLTEIPCPTCGYNMSGLKGTRCPECGSEFTLDAILAGQAANRQAEVER